MRSTALLLTLFATIPSMAAPLFRITLGCESTTVLSEATPVSDSRSCGTPGFGTFSTTALSTAGRVGVGTTASTSHPAGAGNSQADALFEDTIIFSNPDPSAPAIFDLSINLLFEGSLYASGPSGAASSTINLSLLLLGSFSPSLSASFSTDPLTGFQLNTGGFTGTGMIVPGSGGFGGIITTPVTQSSLGSHLLRLTLSSTAFASGVGASSTADFADTFGLPTGVPVFNLPDGYTANAGDWLVNNRFVDPADTPGGAVPEPGAIGLVGAGLTAIAFARRRSYITISPRRIFLVFSR
jgi:hypothetical protein